MESIGCIARLNPSARLRPLDSPALPQRLAQVRQLAQRDVVPRGACSLDAPETPLEHFPRLTRVRIALKLVGLVLRNARQRSFKAGARTLVEVSGFGSGHDLRVDSVSARPSHEHAAQVGKNGGRRLDGAEADAGEAWREGLVGGEEPVDVEARGPVVMPVELERTEAR